MQEKLTRKQKFFHFLFIPILSFPAFYILYYLLSSLFQKEMPTVMTILATAIGVSIVHWINVVYPPPPHDSKEHKKSFKEYIKQYIINGSVFHKLMVMIYSLSVIIVIVVIWLYGTSAL
ncbi:hypothetical protein KFZ56_15840 [Virgibacillus sp. NKC19-3]|uniref:hypothetical protein n=1 Tax=Virgibacillus saliphilus TaxID=2831674 RepID=UPI001C9B1B91|nr:hypothetical protein [Virgibacillus sp. NKC19-3]MBY7144495.1 hypothetical protein [Virgibacillus sp. NKC19-3]